VKRKYCRDTARISDSYAPVGFTGADYFIIFLVKYFMENMRYGYYNNKKEEGRE
jgi:hypothetical protein